MIMETFRLSVVIVMVLDIWLVIVLRVINKAVTIVVSWDI
jgi:hypothetical protein